MAGRPEFIPTAVMREEVEILIAARVSEEDIAKKLRIDPKTLRKHFTTELEEGFAKRNGELILKCYRAAIGDEAKVADRRLWREIVASGVPQPNEAATLAPSEPMGKKEKRIAEAGKVGAGTEWADLIMPATRPVVAN